MIDADGVVIASFFESSLQLRPAADQLLRAALGEEVELPPLAAADGSVTFDVHLDGIPAVEPGGDGHDAPVLHGGVVRDLIVRFAVPDGQHLYGEPVPDGMVATSIEIDPAPALVIGEPSFPPTSVHTLAGTGETLQVYEGGADGEVVVRVPVTHLSRSLTDHGDGTWTQRFDGTVRWQACDDQTCHLPRAERFSIEVPALPHRGPQHELANPDGMDVRTHFNRMVERRDTDRTLREALRAMAGEGDG